MSVTPPPRANPITPPANDGNEGRRGGRNGRRGGGFRFDCEVSHFSLDDPIVFPNEVGAAHDHMFWGNTSTDAFSTEESLLANVDSTCEGRRDGNQAASWTPVLFDEDGNTAEPTDIDVRYRGRHNVDPIANGLQMLATHPYRIPPLRIDLEFDLDIDTAWRLSSDMDGMAQGESLHADYMAAWTDDATGS